MASASDVITAPDGRAIGFAEFGDPDGTAVLWCHGGPGSRLEPAPLADHSTAAGLRVVGIDRPGYGLSPPRPGRTIVDWIDDARVVADALDIDAFATVGISTGGAYALAVAACVPDRVLAVVPCAAMTDMSYLPCRATMSETFCHAVWDAPNRAAAIAQAEAAHGAHGEKLAAMAPHLPAADQAVFRDPNWLGTAATALPAMFAFGLDGYADDRLADGPGWTDFDVAAITCPVTVLHGALDPIVDVSHARHTAAIVPTAQLDVRAELGHFSIVAEVVDAVRTTLRRRGDGTA